MNYIENEKNKIKIEAKCNKEENNYIIWIESKNYENQYLKWKSYEGKSTSLTIKEKEEEYDKLSDKEKKILKLEEKILIQESFLINSETRNFFGEEYLKNEIRHLNEEIVKINSV